MFSITPASDLLDYPDYLILASLRPMLHNLSQSAALHLSPAPTSPQIRRREGDMDGCPRITQQQRTEGEPSVLQITQELDKDPPPAMPTGTVLRTSISDITNPSYSQIPQSCEVLYRVRWASGFKARGVPAITHVHFFCMLVSCISLTSVLGLIAFDTSSIGALVIMVLAVLMMAIQFIVYGTHQFATSPLHVWRAGAISLVNVVKRFRSLARGG
ncbi:hypothetical protein M413DRAFT_24749 [Hebeloma cylindrosporum]|uniref:Uncharacterized protein n=1 Tax=Hebeloma cylindrosporum TaxID=76867 RepID=A0A0C3CN64_HEBCY|nr:hypothetical protein M413DRAFT_24749 [Hebeloma cylindrosporum h7]